jgi:phage gp46-like protein
LNDRPGRGKVITAVALMNGISVHLPNEWLANGDGPFSTEFTDQQRYGSDIWLLRRTP